MKPIKISDKKWIVEHEQYGPVVFDLDTQKYQYVDNENMTFKYNGKSCRFFYSIHKFNESNLEHAVIPVVCSANKRIKKRMLATLIDIHSNIYDFYNIEYSGGWYKNNIINLFPGLCYFIIVSRNLRLINNCNIISILKIEEGMHLMQTLD